MAREEDGRDELFARLEAEGDFPDWFAVKLAEAVTPEERQEAWEEYIQSDEFCADSTEAARLLSAGDVQGLIDFANRDVSARARARAEEIRRGE